MSNCKGIGNCNSMDCADTEGCVLRPAPPTSRELLYAERERALAALSALPPVSYYETTKPTNPKDSIGSSKVPMHLWPETATVLGAMGLLDGACKYGRQNYRAIGVRASIYYDAAKRHLNAWMEGEDTDPDSGLPHLAHALASIAIVVDAQAAGKLTDDRNVKGGYRALIDSMTPHVARLKELHKDKHPHHYTISDEVK
jgi:hypothetical protein